MKTIMPPLSAYRSKPFDFVLKSGISYPAFNLRPPKVIEPRIWLRRKPVEKTEERRPV